MNKILTIGGSLGLLGLAIILLVYSFGNREHSPIIDDQDPVNTGSYVIENKKTEKMTKKFEKAEQVLEKGKEYSAILHTTEGDIELSLNANETPITVNNFVFLSKEGFYDNTIFHRVIDGFMIQGGDPDGNGTGGPGYRFDDENFSGEYTRGTIAMANAGANTNGSQFFIMHQDYDLPKNYVIFGNVTKGIEIVDKIATAQTTFSLGGEQSKPVNPVSITSIEIIEK